MPINLDKARVGWQTAKRTAETQLKARKGKLPEPKVNLGPLLDKLKQLDMAVSKADDALEAAKKAIGESLRQFRSRAIMAKAAVEAYDATVKDAVKRNFEMQTPPGMSVVERAKISGEVGKVLLDFLVSLRSDLEQRLAETDAYLALVLK